MSGPRAIMGPEFLALVRNRAGALDRDSDGEEHVFEVTVSNIGTWLFMNACC